MLTPLRHRIAFARAQRRWFGERALDVPEALSREPVRAAAERLSQCGPAPDREPVVVVVPHEGSAFGNFEAGTRNFYYEAAQSLREVRGDNSVVVLDVDPGTPAAQWHAGLLDLVMDARATHIIAHAECDPGTDGAQWSWDVPWGALGRNWDGAFLGVMFDSAYEWTEAKGRLLARMSPRFMLVDICEPMDGSLVRGRPEVGPINMPMSRESLALVDQRLSGLEPEHDVSFIGALYPYRLELIERMRAQGIDVVVNPHRPDETRDFEASRANQPSWLDYMAGLRRSRMTINFSRSSAGPIEQLKTRVLEAMLARTLLLTDDRDRTKRFWEPEEEFAFFPDVEHLPDVVSRWLGDPDRLRRVAEAGERKARELAPTAFWAGIDAGLAKRGLPRVLTDRI